MTTFGQAVKSCFNQYCGFKGRASRAEFWWFTLFTAIVGFVLGFVDGLLFTSTENAFFALLGFSGLFRLGVFLPALAVTARRLHDTDKSGWWMLLYLTIIGGIVVFIFTLLRGNEGSNKYGEDPYAVANK
ncbi:MAG: DUF805 domain-containing protein [Succinivibrio sp.]|nr:DUF805 domain-containing protein [Succinivibrio sp.]MDY4992324.1 DUF805 domain-containing protein [Succinivibrio sp.]